MAKGKIVELKNNYGTIDTDAYKVEHEWIPFRIEKSMLEEIDGKQYIKLMKSKYGFDFNEVIVKQDFRRLVNQMWKLIPMRENNENWQTHLNIVIEEVSGLEKIFSEELDFLVLLSKLEGLTSQVCEDFMVYRKTVFRCIELISRMVPNNE